MIKLKCEICGLTEIGESLIEIMKELSGKGCTFAIGYKTWCLCGSENSFQKIVIEKSENTDE